MDKTKPPVKLPFVSVIMPVRSEAAYIERSLGSVLAQDYPAERMELIVADGMSADGKWVLTTNTDLPAATVALKYKELWQVEKVFRDVKSVLDTRPIFHQRDDTIRGHVFCSFLALVLRKELERRLNHAGHNFEWNQIKQDLKALQEVTVKEHGMKLVIRTQSRGVCGKVFQAVGAAIPPTIREIES